MVLKRGTMKNFSNKNLEVDNLIMALTFAANYDETLKMYRQYHLVLPEEIKVLLKKIKSNKILNQNMINKYFEYGFKSQVNHNLFSLLFSWKKESYNMDFYSYIQHLRRQNHQDIMDRLISKLMLTDLDQTAFKSKFVQILNQSNFSDSIKWSITEWLYEPQVMREQLVEFLVSCYETIDFTSFNDQLYSWSENLRTFSQTDNFNQMLIDLGWQLKDKLFVMPRFIDPYALDYIDDSDGLYIYVGPNYKILYDMYMKKDDDQWLMKSLKLLADPVRFRIVTLLKNRSYYGTELSNLLGLGHPTITHHMRALGFSHLIDEESKQQRTYYHLNMASLKRLQEILNQKFDYVAQEGLEVSDKFFRVISDEVRFEVLMLLKDGPMTNKNLIDCFKLSPGTMTHHMKLLEGQSLVLREKRNREVSYKMNNSAIAMYLNKWL